LVTTAHVCDLNTGFFSSLRNEGRKRTENRCL
jgi:hypothetical protein